MGGVPRCNTTQGWAMPKLVAVRRRGATSSGPDDPVKLLHGMWETATQPLGAAPGHLWTSNAAQAACRATHTVCVAVTARGLRQEHDIALLASGGAS